MRAFFKITLLLLLPAISLGQQYAYYHFPTKKEHDNLEFAFKGMNNDTDRMAAYRQFGYYFAESKRDSALYFMNQELAVAKKLGFRLWEADALDNSAYLLWHFGDYPGALQRFLEGIKIAEDPANEKANWGLANFATNGPSTARLIILAQLHFDLATLYETAGYTQKAFIELSKGEKVAKENNDKSALSQIYEGLGGYYMSNHQTDSALIYLQRSLVFTKQSAFNLFEGDCLNYIGNAWLIKGNYIAAKTNFLKSVAINTAQNSNAGLTHNYLSIANLFLKQKQKDSSLYYAKRALALTVITKDISDAATVYNSLSAVFKFRNNIDSAYKYQGMALAAKDSLNNAEKVKQFENIGFTEQLRIQQLESEKVATQTKIRTYSMILGLAVFVIIAIILYRNNRQKQKANAVLENTLIHLKATQTQLIQSEKMASLGELTAGIAHEIQNPLNFVNNFSEVNTELIEEMQQGIENGDYEDVKALAGDIKENQLKINQHGKRADFIVKGMLQHSRTSTGERQETNINILADEFLKLSYHGLRAKDKSFNSDMITNFDENLPKVNVIQQDIGRVLLNLFNNAFYAVNQKMKTVAMHSSGAGSDYKPTVTVSTSSGERQIIIKVKDNGIGMPEHIKEKIMQPFFTTKPTGEGTGLGLSLTYDMVVKGHGGSIEVNSVEGEGSEFIISLPVNANL